MNRFEPGEKGHPIELATWLGDVVHLGSWNENPSLPSVERTTNEHNIRSYCSETVLTGTGRELLHRARASLFANCDPMGFEASDANLYRYVANNPTNATDPSGQSEMWMWNRTQRNRTTRKTRVWDGGSWRIKFPDHPKTTEEQRSQERIFWAMGKIEKAVQLALKDVTDEIEKTKGRNGHLVNLEYWMNPAPVTNRKILYWFGGPKRQVSRFQLQNVAAVLTRMRDGIQGSKNGRAIPFELVTEKRQNRAYLYLLSMRLEPLGFNATIHINREETHPTIEWGPDSEAELSALIAHELSHKVARTGDYAYLSRLNQRNTPPYWLDPTSDKKMKKSFPLDFNADTYGHFLADYVKEQNPGGAGLLQELDRMFGRGNDG